MLAIKFPPHNLFQVDGQPRLKALYFQHHSPFELSSLIPQTYSSIEKSRAKDIGQQNAHQYIISRKNHEKQYHHLLGINSSTDTSFIYATLVDFNKMESALSYPGFTYYFTLTHQQINQSIFELIAGKDKSFNIKPSLGKESLLNCMGSWLKNYNNFQAYYDKLLEGNIDPRIEVVINFEVKPTLFIPEIEQR